MLENDDKGNIVPTMTCDLPYERIHVIADNHHQHKNIIKYCHRPFMTLQEETALRLAHQSADRDAVKRVPISDETLNKMNETIIDNTNASVGQDDILFILGDFAMTRDPAVVRYWRSRIVCRRICFVWGNHDARGLQDIFDSVSYCLKVQAGEKLLVLKHWPILTMQWTDPNVYHLWGHCHGSLNSELAQTRPHEFLLDVGVDSHHFKPWNLQQICEVMAKRMP